LGEWTEIKKLTNTINDEFPTLGITLSCFYGKDHQDTPIAQQCRKRSGEGQIHIGFKEILF